MTERRTRPGVPDFVVENVGAVTDLGQKADRLLADLRRGLGRKLPNAAPLRY